ncbi:MAG TPA: hypothetical protein VEQ16_10255 [Acidocella sp.]|nr:hypothetical protein [Acidocella sp.]
MTPDGQFVEPPKPSILTWLLRLAMFGLTLGLIVALFWTLVLVVPLLILAGIVGFFLFRPRVTWINTRRF